MNSIVFFAACALLLIIVLAKIPGLEHFVRPMIQWLFQFMTWIIENSFAWGVFAVKALFFAHVEVGRNLIYKAEELDPTLELRERQSSAP